MSIYSLMHLHACAWVRLDVPQAKIHIKKRCSSIFNFKPRNIFYSFNIGYVCSNVAHQKINVTIIEVNINELQILACITFEH